jgi:NTP pyrophosphatase (non-canonical NTP hydrolase)
MARFYSEQSLRHLQEFTNDIYGVPDDRQYSLEDLLTHMQRFAMRALKGIRKENLEKTKTNLIISLLWALAIANRLHIDLEDEVWQRFPMLCSYCGKQPCACKTIKASQRLKVKIDNALRPKTLNGLQQMFNHIYPDKSRTIVDAGIHFAEEVGEVSEAIHNYIGQHLQKQFEEVRLEMADFVSCVLGIANSLNIELGKELADMFHDNCHVCHTLPCSCTFTTVALLKT